MPMYYRDFPVGRGGFPDGEIYQEYPKLRMHITVFYLLEIHYLVGGFKPFWKILVSWDDYSQYMEKMFQTTNQLW